MKEEIKTREFEVRSQSRKNAEEEEFLAYQVKTNTCWLTLIFPQESAEKFSEDVKTILKERNFKIVVPDNDTSWNIGKKHGFDVVYVNEIISAEKLEYKSRKEKYFG